MGNSSDGHSGREGCLRVRARQHACACAGSSCCSSRVAELVGTRGARASKIVPSSLASLLLVEAPAGPWPQALDGRSRSGAGRGRGRALNRAHVSECISHQAAGTAWVPWQAWRGDATAA